MYFFSWNKLYKNTWGNPCGNIYSIVFRFWSANLQYPKVWMRFCENKKPELRFKEFIIVLLLTGAKGRYKMNLISFTIHGLYGTVLNI